MHLDQDYSAYTGPSSPGQEAMFVSPEVTPRRRLADTHILQAVGRHHHTFISQPGSPVHKPYPATPTPGFGLSSFLNSES